jgi:hypothetical protein
MASEWWQSTIDPRTGQYFKSYEDANSYAMGQGQKEANKAFNTTNPSQYAWSGDAPDWSKTGWNIGENGKYNYSNNYFTAPTGTFGFQIGDNVGYVDATTGDISYGTPGKSGAYGYDARLFGSGYTTGGGGVSADKTYGTKTGSGRWDLDYDYGLGNEARGIIPLQHDQTGQVTQFLAPVAGGGFTTVQSLGDAIALRDEYSQWLTTNPAGVTKPQSMSAPPAPPAPPPPPGNLDTPDEPQPRGVLADPLQGEQYYDDTSGFYKEPTEAKKKWDETANQEPIALQNWNKQSGRFNQPTQSTQLFDSYKDILSNPGYLDDFYNREAAKTQTTLDRKSSSGGWGNSGAAARATSNIGQDFADKALLSRLGFMTTGMDLAGRADTSENDLDITGNVLATSADKGINDKIGVAGDVDRGMLEKIQGGQYAANSAEGLTMDRETGGIKYATKIAEDMSNLMMQGLSEDQARQLATDMSDLQMQVESGKLTAQQAYAQAQEMMQGLGVVSNTVLNALIGSKFKSGGVTPTASK